MQIYRSDRTNSRGGGLLTAVRTSLASYRLSLPPCTSADIEALGVRIWLRNSWISFINIYSPSGAFPEYWFEELLLSIEEPFLILGDFNLNLLSTRPPIPTQVRRFLDWSLSQSFFLLNVDIPTRITHNSASLLDLTIVSPGLNDTLSYLVHPDPFDSDHQPIVISFNESRTFPTVNTRSPVHWSRAGDNLNSILESSVPNNIDSFIHYCHNVMANHRIRHSVPQPSHSPWWDATCRKLLGLKRKYLRLARSLCSRDYWLSYKRTSCHLRSYIKRASRRYWDSVCRESSKNGRIFKILKGLARRGSPTGDNILRNPVPVASTMAQANIFLNVFRQDDPHEPIPNDLSGGDTTLDAPFSLSELSQAIRNTRPTTPGADGISIKLFQHLTHFNTGILLDIFNNMFDTATVPVDWKIATIVPVLKPGKPAHLASSYRPIALTSVCAKVFERMLLHRLVIWAGQHSLFHPSHFGFMPFQDSSTSLCTFIDDVTKARDARHHVLAVCLDIKAAYDSVWIDGLISKMASLGIRGKIGNWIASFLTDRSIRIRWKSAISSLAPVLRGVPQGSVLSPFLFLVYMADVFEITQTDVHLLLYADDIIVYAIGSDATTTHRKLQDAIDRLTQWCAAWKLSLSPDKSTSINFSRRRDPGPPVKLLGHEIEWCSIVKILGVWFSRTLSFTHHFTYLRTKAFKRLNYIKAVASYSRGISSYHMIQIINALIRSLLEYACPILLDACPSALNNLEVIYHSAIRTATSLPRWTPIPVLRREAGVSSVSSRFSLLTKLFLVRHLSLPPGLAFGDRLRSSLDSNNHPSSRFAWRAQELLNLYNVDHNSFIRFSWPSLPLKLNLQIITDGLPFQEKDFPRDIIQRAWYSWRSSIGSSTLLATDASKDEAKTAIAAVNETEDLSIAALVPHLNSIFTAEALAICLALTRLVSRKGQYFLITDSLSVLHAINSFTIRSPRVINMLHNLLHRLLRNGYSFTLVWCPGHKGIVPNEKADSLARQGPYQVSNYNWLSPEDLNSRIRRDWNAELDYFWMNSDYYHNFDFLTADRRYSSWTQSRLPDTWIARWRTRTLLTNSQLFRMNMAVSPLCPFCHARETADHILLHCPQYSTPRSHLLATLNLTPLVSYSEVLSAALVSPRGVSALVAFSSAVLRS